MFKKNLWIVALLTALSFTAFMTTSCVDAIVVEEDTMTYSYVDLGTSFNTWGGQAYQSGWSTDNATWNDPNHKVKNLGLKLDDFKAARYLEIELNVDSLAGALDVMWGNESNGWNQTNGLAAGGAKGPLKIDLTKLKGYANYKASTEQIRIILQYNQPGQVAGLVKSAQLAIPDDVPFVPVTDIALEVTEGYTGARFKLVDVVTPLDATKNTVIWSIVSYTLKKDGTTTAIDVAANHANYESQKTALENIAGFIAGSSVVIVPGYKWTDYSVYPPKEYVSDDVEEITRSSKSPNWIKAITEEGTLKVRATVLEGGEDEKNYTQDFYIPFNAKPKLGYSLVDDTTAGAGAVTKKETDQWGALQNSNEFTWVSVVPPVAPETASPAHTVSWSNGYGNCYYYIRIELDANINTYSGLRFKYKGVSGDFNNKSDFRIMGGTAIPADGAYNPGTLIAKTNDKTGDVSKNAKQMTAFFNSAAKGFNTNTFYIWFMPWASACSFTISDLEFFKADPCPCDGAVQAAHKCDNCNPAPTVFCNCDCLVCNPAANLSATYNVPSGSATTFYLNLNNAVTEIHGRANVRAVKATNQVTYHFNGGNPRVAFPFGAELGGKIDAALKAGIKVSFKINGTTTNPGSGNTITNSGFRYILGDHTTGSNFNIVGWNESVGSGIGTVEYSAISTSNVVPAANSSLILDAQNLGGMNTAVNITSIMVTIPDTPIDIKTASVTVTAPAIGVAPNTTVTPGSATYTASAAVWTETGKTAQVTTFAGGGSYTVKFTLTAAGKNTFKSMQNTGAISVSGAMGAWYTKAKDNKSVEVNANFFKLPALNCGCTMSACLAAESCGTNGATCTSGCTCDCCITTFTVTPALTLAGSANSHLSIAGAVITSTAFPDSNSHGFTITLPATSGANNIPLDKYSQIEIVFTGANIVPDAGNTTGNDKIKLGFKTGTDLNGDLLQYSGAANSNYADVGTTAVTVKFKPADLSTNSITVQFNNYSGTTPKPMEDMTFELTVTSIKLLAKGDVVAP